jgi:hypothetical protein
VAYNAGNLALVIPERRELEPRAPSNRRAHERLTVSELTWLNQVRLKYGPPVSLLDLSIGGAQIETTSHRLQPGSNVVIEIAAQDQELAVPARVLRCQVSGLAPLTTYRGALEFKRPIVLPEISGDTGQRDNNNPLHEHARLTAVLRRSHTLNGVASPNLCLTDVGTNALAAAQAMIESPSARRAGEPFLRNASRLLSTITRCVQQGESPDGLLIDMIEWLRRSVPARSVRLVDASAAVAVQSPDAIAFDVPSAHGSETKLLVEFPHGCRLEEWHLQLLKTAAHLVTITKDLDRARPSPQEVKTDDPRLERTGWHRLVVRYTDGRILKGYGQDFSPLKGRVQVWAAPDCPKETRVSVALSQLKAVFFVHDLDGAANLPEPPQPVSEPGRRIIVTFLDGEVLTATTFNYSPNGPGFFVTPVDAATNNQRIFVVSTAVARVHFP